jgi:nitronate monooxygenase
MVYPSIIQGGMGAGISNWRLARAVSQLGQLGVVSGTALDQVLARRLQDGDPGGHMRQALDHFPVPQIAERAWQTYFIPGGKAPRAAYKTVPMPGKGSFEQVQDLCVLANFVEVFLARQGHNHPVGINYLEKIQAPHLASIYGAMLGDVGYILMGAGIPIQIPGILDRFVNHEAASYPLQVTGAQPGDDTSMTFDPRQVIDGDPPPLTRPKFLAIIASNILATTMIKRATGAVNGFIIEGNTAGGHNAPPRGKLQLNELAEPIYGERDVVDLEKIRVLGLPFWLAGGYDNSVKLHEAKAAGAAGVQVGTAFAFCAESGLTPDYKNAILQKVKLGDADVFTDAQASPTGFPFKVVQLEGTMSEQELYEARPRICDVGYLREAYRTADGRIEYRCASEPLTTYAAKGGNPEDAAGRKCLCNSLLANIGHAQIRNGKHIEVGLVTAGNALAGVQRFLPHDGVSYTAADVIATLLQ